MNFHGRQTGLVVGLVAVMVGGCASTKFESTWTDPNVQRGELAGKRVAAFVLTESESMRRSGEDTLARALTKHGVMGIAGYQLASSDETSDRAALQSKLQTQKVDAMVLMKILSTRQVVSYPYPGYYGPYYGFAPTYYGGYGSGYGYGYGAFGGDYPATDTIVTVETAVYSVPENTLMWTGVSDTTDPLKVDNMIWDIADRAAKEMKKKGLIAH
jgi:hypothetical protein